MDSPTVIPRAVSPYEVWIAKHNVDTVNVFYRMTSEDTADNFFTLSSGKDRLTIGDGEFRKIADLQATWPNLVKLKYGIREAVEAREKYDRNNSAELATYRRLRRKYKDLPDDVS